MSINVQGLTDAMGIGYYILVYAIGILAMAFSVSAIQFKHRVTVIIMNFLGQVFWIAYFVVQGDLTSAIACALSAVMLAVFAKSDKWKWALHPVTIAFFIVVLSGFSLLTFKTWSDIFPVSAGVFAVITNSRKTEKALRRFYLPWCVSWLLNSLFKMYPVALVNDCFCTVSGIVALIRFRKADAQTRQKD